MGIPQAAFRAGDLYIEYWFEDVLYRYEKESRRYFRRFYDQSHEIEVPYDSKLLCDATCRGVLTTAERYFSGGAPVAEDPSADSFSRMAVKYQRIRPYWLGVMYLNDYAHSGDIEVGADGGIEVIEATDSIKEHLGKAVSDINSQPYLEVTCADDIPFTIHKMSKDYDFGLRLELKKRELTVVSESSSYQGRSSL